MAVSKYIKSYVNEKEGFIFHHKNDEFYLLSFNDQQSVEQLIETLNRNRFATVRLCLFKNEKKHTDHYDNLKRTE